MGLPCDTIVTPNEHVYGYRNDTERQLYLVQEQHRSAGSAGIEIIGRGLLCGQLQHRFVLSARLPDDERRAQLQLSQAAVDAFILFDQK